MPATKIVCTLGPASSKEKMLGKMTEAGMSVARLNMSHGDLNQHQGFIKLIRKINKKSHRRIRTLIDLEGPRIRIGKLKNKKPIPLKSGQTVWLIQDDIAGSGSNIPFDYEGPLESVRGADYIYIDDGLIALKIQNISKNRIKTKVMWDSLLKEHKGINIPGAALEFSGLSSKDEEDIRFGISQKVDWIAQSFVRNAEDILEVKNRVQIKHPNCKIVAKIENWDGINNIDEIIAAADGIMVARGDMGASVPIYEVPIIQKKIIRKCNQKKKFVITATQMLESMTENIRPTRAEVTDVANAILDGTDYVMLSAESASGRYPLEAVQMMANIINFTEQVEFLL